MNNHKGEILRVLLVDDDEEDYLLTRGMLNQIRGRKIELDWAPTYETGWQKIQSDHYAAVLVDYDLDGRTGIELIRETVECGFQVPLILYTGRGSYEVDVEAMHAGASLYLAKGEANPLLLERFIRYALERKQSEALLNDRNEALRESESRFRALADNMSQLAWMADDRGNVFWYNRRWFEYTGTTLEEVKGWGWQKVHHPDHVGCVVEKISECIESGSFWEDTFPLRGKDAEYRWFLSRATPIFNEGGEVVRWIGTNTDVTELRNLQQQVEQERARLQTIFQFAPAGIYEVDFMGRRFTSVNDEMCEMSGYSREELLQMNPIDLLDEPGKILFRKRIDQWSSGVKPEENVEYRMKTRDGRTIYVLLNSTFICNDAGDPLKATVVGFDITARKQVEDDLAEDLAAMERLHNLSTRFIEAGDEASVLQEVLEAAIEIVGADMGNVQMLDPENQTLSIVAQRGFEAPFLDYFNDIELHEPAACSEASRRMERVVIEDVEKSPVFFGAPSLNVLRAAGVRAVQSTPLLSRSGRLVGVLSTHWRRIHRPEARTLRLVDLLARQAADLTERKRVVEALRESEERFRAMADGTPVIIWVTDTNGQMEFINQAYSGFFGFSSEQIRSNGWQPLVHPDDRSAYIESFMESLSLRIEFRAEARVRNKDGEWRWIVSYGRPRFSSSGDFLGMAGSSFDITDRRSIEKSLQVYTEQLKHSNQELENFAFMASHELQEPLRKIEKFGKLLAQRAGPALGETDLDYLERMLGAAVRMRKMIDELLALSRITSQGQPFQDVDLYQLVRAVMDDLEGLLHHGGQVEIEDLGMIQADPVQMHRLFQNLIGNALKFHKPGRPQKVKVQSKCLPGAWLEITIEDNGIGFEPDQANQLFRPFHRLHGRSAYEGTGIGLSMCRKIVERHGGRITASGVSGHGSTFTVILPVNQPLERAG